MGFSKRELLLGIVGIAVIIITCSHLLPNALAETAKRKGTVKTIHSENGEVIDCVDLYKQPAFDHPLLKNHQIQMGRSSTKNANKDDKKVRFQEWHKNGEYCPEGSIPIVRNREYSVYPKKVSTNGFNRSVTKGEYHSHEYAGAAMAGYGRFTGANATLNVWNPLVLEKEYSGSQMWIFGGKGPNFTTIETGWITRSDTGDTAIFVYWTTDSYVSTGCFDFECSGFLQVSRTLAIGAALKPISAYDGKQYVVNLSVLRHPQSMNWWLIVDGEDIGYWPEKLLPELNPFGNRLSFGGEIVNTKIGGRHTATQMGSGLFPNEGYRKASFFRNVQGADVNGIFRDPVNLVPYATKPSCYDVVFKPNTPARGVHFFYGGPGFSDQCQT